MCVYVCDMSIFYSRKILTVALTGDSRGERHAVRMASSLATRAYRSDVEASMFQRVSGLAGTNSPSKAGVDWKKKHKS